MQCIVPRYDISHFIISLLYNLVNSDDNACGICRSMAPPSDSSMAVRNPPDPESRILVVSCRPSKSVRD
jgi:hypothetical protein